MRRGWTKILRSELIHFVRSPFKVVALLLFISASIYGLQNGYVLYQTHLKQIEDLHAQNTQEVDKITDLYNRGEKALKERPHMDITIPLWALYYTPSTTSKPPSSLMPFAIGQAEQYGYYKEVSEWSTTFDNDLAEEIANPERLAIGTLDFSFVVLYLMPILAIVLLYNIGGLETDLVIDKLIKGSVQSYRRWLLVRFTFYFFVLIGALLVSMMPYVILTGAFADAPTSIAAFFAFTVLYITIWFSAFYIVNISGKGSSTQALQMVSIWLFFCVLTPGTVQQLAAIKYPTSYMTDYIDAKREETYKIWYLPTDSMYNKLLRLHPDLSNTSHGKDSIINPQIVSSTSCVLVNEMMKNTALTIENRNEEKNRFIRHAYWINPVSFFQNKLNALTNNDYYAFLRFRNQIQSKVDKMANFRLYGYWDRAPITKQKYLQFVKALQD